MFMPRSSQCIIRRTADYNLGGWDLSQLVRAIEKMFSVELSRLLQTTVPTSEMRQDLLEFLQNFGNECKSLDVPDDFVDCLRQKDVIVRDEADQLKSKVGVMSRIVHLFRDILPRKKDIAMCDLEKCLRTSGQIEAADRIRDKMIDLGFDIAVVESFVPNEDLNEGAEGGSPSTASIVQKDRHPKKWIKSVLIVSSVFLAIAAVSSSAYFEIFILQPPGATLLRWIGQGNTAQTREYYKMSSGAVSPQSESEVERCAEEIINYVQKYRMDPKDLATKIHINGFIVENEFDSVLSGTTRDDKKIELVKVLRKKTANDIVYILPESIKEAGYTAMFEDICKILRKNDFKLDFKKDN